ncbi:hypothetical protein H6G97_45930 [Nostoc flagelliforme FACHB-838]|uniref:Uncharacterized protein n=1 Tax=Nostoc flagelliforme FACHB-838 TaxID=2692904 RepID=A0ABR8E404_9NOSO|nr:hypothetical protein [Nostoc flagelliforme]MBD2536245.1 hypothetical protein [Nostoc flagelliforme FACHB-838]
MLSPYSIASLIDYPKITGSAADVGYWSDEWGVGEKSGAEIRFSSSFVHNPLLR